MPQMDAVSYVIDGGSLLQKIPWQKMEHLATYVNSTFDTWPPAILTSIERRENNT